MELFTTFFMIVFFLIGILIAIYFTAIIVSRYHIKSHIERCNDCIYRNGDKQKCSCQAAGDPAGDQDIISNNLSREILQSTPETARRTPEPFCKNCRYYMIGDMDFGYGYCNYGKETENLLIPAEAKSSCQYFRDKGD